MFEHAVNFSSVRQNLPTWAPAVTLLLKHLFGPIPKFLRYKSTHTTTKRARLVVEPYRIINKWYEYFMIHNHTLAWAVILSRILAPRTYHSWLKHRILPLVQYDWPDGQIHYSNNQNNVELLPRLVPRPVVR